MEYEHIVSTSKYTETRASAEKAGIVVSAKVILVAVVVVFVVYRRSS